MSTESSNFWEAARRAEKVQRLTNAIDAVAVSRGVDPLRDADDVAERLTAATEQFWILISGRAKVKLPSETTRAAVVSAYLGRVDAYGRRAS